MEIIDRKIGVGDDQVKGIELLMGWDMNVLREIKAVKEVEEFGSRAGGGFVDMDVEITEGYNIG